MPTVLITGASGLVGSYVIQALSTQFQWLTPDSKTLDITNQAQTDNYVASHEFDYCLHLAAYTNVDQAENNQQLCHKINVLGTKNLFASVSRKSKPFIFVSTDFVFNGKEPNYDENSQPDPISYYGKTKYEAEQFVKNKAMIVRLSYPYGSLNQTRPDFVQTILRRLKTQQTVQGITDSTFTPTYLADIANGLAYFLNHFQPKVYHLVGAESLSPYSAFIKIANVFKLDPGLVKPTTFAQYFYQKAARPKQGMIKSRYQFFQNRSFTNGLELVKELSS